MLMMFDCRTRSLLGLDEDQIRLEDDNCLGVDNLPPYCFKEFHLMPVSSRKPKLISVSEGGELLDEKTAGT
jgi:hypothetical protein